VFLNFICQFCAFDPLSPIKQSEHQDQRGPTSESSSSSDPDQEVEQIHEPPKKTRATRNDRSSMLERAIQIKNSNFIDLNPFQGEPIITPSEPLKNNKNSGAGQQVSTKKVGKSYRRKTVVVSSGNSSSPTHPFSALSAQLESKVNTQAGSRLSDQSSYKHEVRSRNPFFFLFLCSVAVRFLLWLMMPSCLCSF
jgi:hypothetical protein